MVVVTYHCPRCHALAELDRDAYLADKCVTPHPLDGWEYAAPWDAFEEAEGVEIVCGASETEGEGCGEPYYLSFVAFDDGEPREANTGHVDANFDFLGR
jgi:hypothetical protein